MRLPAGEPTIEPIDALRRIAALPVAFDA